MSKMPHELILIRHGVTAWNKERRFQGSIDIPLDEEGRAQAQALGRYLAGQPAPDLLLASDLGRAIETARPVAQAHGLSIQIEPLWRERAYGHFEGKRHDELERDHAEAFARWRERDVAFQPPGGGESIEVFHDRVGRALQGCAERFGPEVRRIMVVTHGGVLGSVYRIAMGLPAHDRTLVPILNTGVNRLWYGDGGWSVRGWGEVFHLD